MHLRCGDGLRTAAGVIVLAVVGAGALHIARAAEWAEPTGIPPTANPPGFVWTRSPTDAPQAGGQFNISGAGKIGEAFDVIGKMTAGELCFGAECKKSWADVSSASVLVQATSPGVTQMGNLNINGIALVKSLTATERISAGGCFGPVFRGKSSTTSNGAVGGYLAANAKCPSGQHVCTTGEVLQSINCGAFDDFPPSVVADNEDLWITNLAPSLPTPTNDCDGWKDSANDAFGIKWRYNRTTGGGAFAQRCGARLPFACCS